VFTGSPMQKPRPTHLIEHLGRRGGPRHNRPCFGTLVNPAGPAIAPRPAQTPAFADLLQRQLWLEGPFAAGQRPGGHGRLSSTPSDRGGGGLPFRRSLFHQPEQGPPRLPTRRCRPISRARPCLFAGTLLARLLRGGETSMNPWGAKIRRTTLAAASASRLWRSSSTQADADMLRMGELSFQCRGSSAQGCIRRVGMGRSDHPGGPLQLMNLLQRWGSQQQGVAICPGCCGGHPLIPGVPGRIGAGAAGCEHSAGTEALRLCWSTTSHTPDGLENALAACRPFLQRATDLCCSAAVVDRIGASGPDGGPLPLAWPTGWFRHRPTTTHRRSGAHSLTTWRRHSPARHADLLVERGSASAIALSIAGSNGPGLVLMRR